MSHTLIRRAFPALVSVAFCLGSAQASASDSAILKKVLVINQSGGFVRTGPVNALWTFIRDTLAPQYGFVAVAPTTSAEMVSKMRDDTLATYQVIVFNNNTSIGGLIVDTSNVGVVNHRQAFQRWFHNGGGVVGWHALADHADVWPWFGDTLFTGVRSGVHSTWATSADRGPGRSMARWDTVQTGGEVRANKPEYAGLRLTIPPAPFEYPDEWYSFTVNPRSKVDVLMTLDEATYSVPNNGAMGDHPIAWAKTFTALPGKKPPRFIYTARGGETAAISGTGTNAAPLDGSLGQGGPTKGWAWESIRWAAGLTQPVALRQTGPLTSQNAAKIFSAIPLNGVVRVNVFGLEGAYEVSLFNLSGERLARRVARGSGEHSFTVKSTGVLLVRVTSQSGTYVRRVAL